MKSQTFDDGDQKSSVEKSRIRSLEKTRRRPTDDDRGDGSGSLSVGDRVEAKCRGWTKHYPGKIKRKNRDGTFDITFDDGDQKVLFVCENFQLFGCFD